MSRQEEKNQKALSALRNRPDNKKCMDCSAMLTQYVVLDFGTWVCMTCSGVHREFNHKIKSPTMSTFTADEVKKLEKQGNDAAHAVWRARWARSQFPEPAAGDTPKIREFIRMTYKDKRWYDDGHAPEQNNISRNPSGNSAPTSSTSNNFGTVKASTSSSSQPQKKNEPSLISWDDIPNGTPAPASTPQPVQMYGGQPQAANPFGMPVNSAPAPANPFLAQQPHSPPPAQNPFFFDPAPVAAPVTAPNPFGQPNPYGNSGAHAPVAAHFNPPTQSYSAPARDVNPFGDEIPVTRGHAPQNSGFDPHDLDFGSLSVSSQPPTNTQRKPSSEDIFDFAALRGPTTQVSKSASSSDSPALLQPPPPRTVNLIKPPTEPAHGTVRRKDSRSSVHPPASVPATTEQHAPKCPLCGKTFRTNTSNDEINRHVDECLSEPQIQESIHSGNFY